MFSFFTAVILIQSVVRPATTFPSGVNPQGTRRIKFVKKAENLHG